ncbi:MAG TPA: Trp biosynthesis-associated membrane protein [Mycobacteriales bacterium]|nr:Trp biosynthesis-associated membrane protein [Mycobacteriales bacterium]
MTGDAGTTGSRERRELRAVVVLCLAGGLLALEALGRAWASYEPSTGVSIDALREQVRGGQVSPAGEAGAILALAGVLALVASKRRLRQAVGAGIALAGVLVCSGAVIGLVRPARDLAMEALGSTALPSQVDVARGWPALTLLGGLLVVLAGGLTLVRGGRWAGLGSSYQAPGAASPEPATDKAVWDALDRGDDPTD